MTTDGKPVDGLTRQEVWTLLENNNKWWRETLGASEKHWQEGHVRMSNALDRNTAAMTDGFNSIRSAMEKHGEEDELVERRVTIIETERGIEKQQAVRRGAVAGSITAALVIGLIESIKKALGR